jgi:hypothetical protein
MSRARPIAGQWFDVQKNNQKATAEQLELLATVGNVDLEDLLDGASFGKDYLTQGDVVAELREAMGQTIPPEVLAKRQKWRDERSQAKECRICGRTGDSTQHHFVNRWILKQLEHYQSQWADRRKNCIPACIECHRDLHSRANGPHSIAHLLNDREKDFAERSIQALYDEKPKLFLMIARGDDSVYETRLIRDWIEGKFQTVVSD